MFLAHLFYRYNKKRNVGHRTSLVKNIMKICILFQPGGLKNSCLFISVFNG